MHLYDCIECMQYNSIKESLKIEEKISSEV